MSSLSAEPTAGSAALNDHLGRSAISALAARRLIAKLRRRDELAAEESERRFAALNTKRPVPVGLPAQEGMTPYESMVAAGAVVMPSVEFAGGRERPTRVAHLTQRMAATLPVSRRGSTTR